MVRTCRALPACLFVLGASVAASACATSGAIYGPQRGYRNVERLAYDNGYRDGLQRGERDARDRRGFRVDRDSDYRNADNGYRGYGDRNTYRRFFRDGYEAGYAEGYNRYARNDRYDRGRIYPPVANSYPGTRGIYGSAATQAGYRDGYEAGRDDARDRQNNDPRRAKRYREGDHDYDSRYGSRDQYKQDYRAAFQQGYEQGYMEYRR